MPAIPYGVGAYRRERGSLPEFTLVNMFLEKTPSAENGVVLMSRPPLEAYSTVGSGPIQGVFSKEGTFGGDIFTVSNGQLYRGTTLLGTVNGTGAVSFASSGFEVLVTAGSTLYSYDGTDLQAVTLPDDFHARAVAFISGHFIAIRDGTHKFYWSAQLDGRDWDALDFASAESEPDNLLDAVEMRGNLYLMGESSIEPWYYTGALDLPFVLVQQRLFPKGTIGTGCAVEMDNALFWVASDGIVYRTADVPERLSDHGIEERISESASVSAYGFILEGHSFFCIRLDDATFAYDAATGQWSEFQSYGRSNFRAISGTSRGQTVILGDDDDGTLWTFSDGFDEEATLVREFTAAFPLKGGTAVVDNVTVDANSGRTDLLAGQGSEPVIEMATSRSAGATWGAFRSARLGAQGEYRSRSRWNRVGMFDAPGAMFKFRVSDPVQLRVSNVLVNEPGGGRSRGS
jgi:hypothetical protein